MGGGTEKEGRLSCLSRKLSLLKTISFAKLTHRFCLIEFWPYESYSYSFCVPIRSLEQNVS